MPANKGKRYHSANNFAIQVFLLEFGMAWINAQNCYGYFGSAKDNICNHDQDDSEKFLLLQKKLSRKVGKSLASLFFLKQTHSKKVFVLSNIKKIKRSLNLFQYSGDAIITTEKNIGISVVTADCLPIILFDPKHQAIGIVHAGWRGLSNKIITETIKKMHDVFKTNPADLLGFLGPSAGVCCYEVQNDLLSHFPNTVLDTKIIEKRDGKFFFNSGYAGFLELLENNVLESSIDIKNNCCTICTPGFCSFRQQKENAGRQASVVFLR